MKPGLRELVFFLLLLGIPAATWWFVFKPNEAKAAQMEKDINAKAHNLEQVSKASANIEKLEAEIKTLASAMEYFRGKLPNQRQIPAILQEISVLVEQNELKLVSISPVASSAVIKYAQDDHYAEQAIEVKLQGDYMAFYAFLQDLETLPRITRIQKLTIEGATLTEAKQAEKAFQEGKPEAVRVPMGHVSVNFLVSIFYDKNPKQD
ncbi:MAG: type 4a pilus biogenesis protein PilO [Phycisphaerae bacterium]